MKKTGFLLSAALAVVCANGETLESLKSRAQALEFTGANGKMLKYRLVEKTPSDGSKVPLLFFFHQISGLNNVCSSDLSERNFRS